MSSVSFFLGGRCKFKVFFLFASVFSVFLLVLTKFEKFCLHRKLETFRSVAECWKLRLPNGDMRDCSSSSFCSSILYCSGQLCSSFTIVTSVNNNQMYRLSNTGFGEYSLTCLHYCISNSNAFVRFWFRMFSLQLIIASAEETSVKISYKTYHITSYHVIAYGRQ